MTTIQRSAAVTLVVSLGIGSWVYAQSGARKASVLTAQDYTEISELYARLYQASDLREPDVWVGSFSEDGLFRLPNGQEVTGRKALAEWRAKSFGGQTGDSKRRHWTSGVMLTPNADGTAKSRAYWLLIDVTKKQAVVTQTGTFDDLVVKTSEGWKFKRHGVIQDPAE